MHFIWNLLDLEIQLYFRLFIFILCLLSIYLSFSHSRALHILSLLLDASFYYDDFFPDPPFTRALLFPLFLGSSLKFCMPFANSLYLCTLKIRFSFWKMENAFFFLHSTAFGCTAHSNFQYHSIELWNKRLLACCCCCCCRCSTDSSISPFYQLCNIIFTKKYCIKSNEWNKCQSAHTFKKVFLSNPATKHENCTDSTFFLVHILIYWFVHDPNEKRKKKPHIRRKKGKKIESQ